MSLWLSTANRIAGSLRGHATAQVKRQVTAATAMATNGNLQRRTAVAKAPAARKKAAKR